MIEIRYHRKVLQYLDGLIDVLIDKGYFAFYETSVQYIEDMVSYIKTNLALAQSKPAPPYFEKYGNNLLYITYRKSRRTTWYIFFQKYDNLYFIRHITNNHVAGQHFASML